MSNPVFFQRACEPTVEEVAGWVGAVLAEGGDPARRITGVAPLDTAGRGDLVFLDNPKYAADLAGTLATACLVPSRFRERVPAGTCALIIEDPYRAFARVVGRLFPDAVRPMSLFGTKGISPGAMVHPDARLEPDVIVDPGAVIGPRAAIGAGTLIGANAVIGADVRIGRMSSIGPTATVVHALIGDRVIIHAGVRIGQDGFGFAMGPGGHMKIPQVGRVVIQDDVEIGAGTTIDRGANRDTVIGEGSKIDNLVQIGHNVVVGRHCVIVAQAGVSGSSTLGDFVAIGGQAGLTGHLKIGDGAQIAASAGVMNDVPDGARWVGAPAQSHRDFFREVATLRRLVQRERKEGSK